MEYAVLLGMRKMGFWDIFLENLFRFLQDIGSNASIKKMKTGLWFSLLNDFNISREIFQLYCKKKYSEKFLKLILQKTSQHQARQTRPNSGGVAEGQPRFDKGGGWQ